MAWVLTACGDDATSNEPSRTPLSTQGAPVALRDGPVITGIDEEDTLSALAAGDFNGDGAVDLALGAAFADGPDNGRPDAGEVYIFLGPVADLGGALSAAAADATLYGAAPGDQAGRALAAGDVTGDGIDDVIVGAPMADSAGAGREDAGSVYVVAGSADIGLAGVDMASSAEPTAFHGIDGADYAGFALETSDLTGDGVDDVVIGAFWADGPANQRAEAGEVYVIQGGADIRGRDLKTEPPDTIVYGAEGGDRLGESLAAGDINGDGAADLIAVATFADGPDNERTDSGEVNVLSAPFASEVDLLTETPLLVAVGTDPGDQLGHSAASGDINGDGFGDLVLGAVSADGPANGSDLAGEAVVIAGSDDLPALIDTAQGNVPIVYGAASGGRLGRSVSTGDLNGDGLADFVLAAPKAPDPGGQEQAGAVYGVFGTVSLSVPESVSNAQIVTYGGAAGDSLGSHIFGKPALVVADLNADGLADVILAASLAAAAGVRRTGEVMIFFAAR